MSELFVDKVRITVSGGRGGDGAVAFHREKYVASGGPDGGDGGHGGSVILRVNDNLSTLLDFRYKRKYAAQSGANGQGRNMSGKRGEPLSFKFPVALWYVTQKQIKSSWTCPPVKTISLQKAAEAAGAMPTMPLPPARYPALQRPVSPVRRGM